MTRMLSTRAEWILIFVLFIFAFAMIGFTLWAKAGREVHEQLRAFQELEWGSTEAEIKLSYPNAEPAACDATVGGPAATYCDSPSLNRFEVDGVPFQVRFGVDAKTRLLERVILLNTARTTTAGASALGSMTAAQHNHIATLLTQRYGPSSSLVIDADHLGTEHGQVWMTRSSSVTLTYTRQASPNGALFMTTIEYAPKKAASYEL